ncbi:DUF4886 domain-containing protein [Acinetobacter sp. ACZLY 512]|uniref:DUF4886 domain-containing protein n=1 Tax=Acinetobacter sp. ACZLY 512 TaxID=2911206 RepID=UPI0020261344|nr:DUF4886 domain-containing protein [Acinetobacter sp. ACZLY 512]MCL9676964.1 DUF4886 domain-containing protein [Acinetobacter sp. ACZLY 512]
MAEEQISVKISELAETNNFNDDDELPLVQNGTTKKIKRTIVVESIKADLGSAAQADATDFEPAGAVQAVESQLNQNTSQQNERIERLEYSIYLIQKNGVFKAYRTKAQMLADIAIIPKNSVVSVVNDPANNAQTNDINGEYHYNGTDFFKLPNNILNLLNIKTAAAEANAKSYADVKKAEAIQTAAFDAQIKADNVEIAAKNYTNICINERTLQSANTDGKELAIITDRNGRRTWIEIGKDGLPTERTNEIIKKAVIQDINTPHLIFVVVDKNGRLISGIDRSGNQVKYSQNLSTSYLSATVDKNGRLISGIDRSGNKVKYSQNLSTSYLSATVDKNGRLISGIDRSGNQVKYSQNLSTSYLSATVDKNGRLISGIDKQGLTYPKSSPISGSGDKKIKILGIGNSFTQDAFMYVPWLLKELGFNNFSVSVLMYGGCTLEQHYNFAINNQSVYDYEIYDTDGPDYWVSKGTKTFKEGINFLNFDTIILQQQSARSWDYSSYAPYLNPLINYIYANTNYTTRLGWHGTPSAPDGQRNGNWNWNGSGSFTSAEFYAKQQDAYQQLHVDTPIEYVIPAGTAVQNLRSTSLKDLGGLNNLTSDGLHLDDGIPCLTASYAVLLKFLEIFKLNGSVFGSRILPTSDWLSNKNIQGPNGTPARVTSENVYIAQKCAIAAIKKPYQTSVIN